MKSHPAQKSTLLVRRPPVLAVFIMGVVIGVSIAVVACNSQAYFHTPTPESMDMPYTTQNLHHVQKLPDGPQIDGNMKHDHAVGYNHGLEKKVRVLCLVLTSPATHQTKAQHVKKTWGKRCNVLLFMSSTEDPSLPTVALKVDKEDRGHLWQKTKLAFEYVHQHYLDEADWFVKADDDTYMIVENLRFMLAPYNNSRPIYFGHRYRAWIKGGYMTGGPGYVLSKEALIRFAKRDPAIRVLRGLGEDVAIAGCLAKLGVEFGYSRDKSGAERFLPLNPKFFLAAGNWKYAYYAEDEGEKAVSDSCVSFHYVEPAEMHVLDFMLYRARTYGLLAWYQENDPKDYKMLIPNSTGAA